MQEHIKRRLISRNNKIRILENNVESDTNKQS